jgi:hypothetical protein
VSFEKGDITTAERSNKQVALSAQLDSFWTEYPICFDLSEIIVKIISLLWHIFSCPQILAYRFC